MNPNPPRKHVDWNAFYRQALLLAAALGLCLMLAQVSRADDIRFAPGTTVTASVSLVADANGVLQIDRTKPITVGAVTGTDTKPDPPKPQPPVDTARVARFRVAADKLSADVEAAKNVGGLYSEMARKSLPPNPLYTTPAALEESIRELTNLFLIRSLDETRWEPFRDLLTDEWVVVAKNGGQMKDYAAVLTDAAAGLNAATGESAEAFDFETITKILVIFADKSVPLIQRIARILPLVLELFAS